MEQYNMFAKEKQGNYPNAAQIQKEQQKRVAGQVQGATVQDFVAGKQAANSQAQGYGANPVVQTQPVITHTTQVKTNPLVSNTKPQNNYGQITSMDDLARAMNYTTPEEEDRLRKASVANQRIMAIGDALRHIGNIANTVNYAPAQQFNDPVALEQARYERGKALRDKANLTYMSYQQQKAAQDAKMRQWEQQMAYNAAKDARDYELRKSESDARNNLREAQMNRYQTMIELDNARREGIISDNEYKKRRAELYPSEVQSRINKNNRTGTGGSRGGGGGSNMPNYETTEDIEWLFDQNGKRIGTRSRKNRTVQGRGSQTTTSTTRTPKTTNATNNSGFFNR